VEKDFLLSKIFAILSVKYIARGKYNDHS